MVSPRIIVVVGRSKNARTIHTVVHPPHGASRFHPMVDICGTRYDYSRRQGQFPASPGLSLKSREHDCHWAGFISTLSRPRLLCPGMPHRIGRSLKFPGRPSRFRSTSPSSGKAPFPQAASGLSVHPSLRISARSGHRRQWQQSAAQQIAGLSPVFQG